MVYLRSGEISVRTAEKGGRVASRVELGPGETPVTKGRVVLLVHGFCNDLDDARESYSIFRYNLSLFKAKQPASTIPTGDIFSFYWPGDKDWGPPRFMSYFLEIAPAEESARVLARFLRDLPHVFDLYLIAHSLGNRVLLGLLDQLRRGGLPPTIQLKGACMMAAAVPVCAVRWQGSLHDASVLTYSQVLYSPADMVLRVAFPLGEAAAFDAFSLEAVGLHGEPRSQWNQTQKMRGRRSAFFGLLGEKDRPYGHSDYWLLKETIDPVARFFDPAAPRPIPRHLISTHLQTPSNELIAATIGKYRAPIHY
jgi:hypothetical protein